MKIYINVPLLKRNQPKEFVLMKLIYIKGNDFIDYMSKHKNSVEIVE